MFSKSVLTTKTSQEALRITYSEKEDRQEYIAALRAIRMEGTDEHLIAFFFKAATKQMEYALAQKKQNSRKMFFF